MKLLNRLNSYRATRTIEFTLSLSLRAPFIRVRRYPRQYLITITPPDSEYKMGFEFDKESTATYNAIMAYYGAAVYNPNSHIKVTDI